VEGVTDHDRDRFTSGYCHVLARAVQLASDGWPIRCFEGEDPRYPTCHAWVETPDGRFLDVEGAQDPNEFLARWCNLEPGDWVPFVRQRVFTWGEVWQAWGHDWKKTGAKERARQIAPILVQSVVTDLTVPTRR
jgi:hypothetical protein